LRLQRSLGLHAVRGNMTIMSTDRAQDRLTDADHPREDIAAESQTSNAAPGEGGEGQKKKRRRRRRRGRGTGEGAAIQAAGAAPESSETSDATEDSAPGANLDGDASGGEPREGGEGSPGRKRRRRRRRGGRRDGAESGDEQPASAQDIAEETTDERPAQRETAAAAPAAAVAAPV